MIYSFSLDFRVVRVPHKTNQYVIYVAVTLKTNSGTLKRPYFVDRSVGCTRYDDTGRCRYAYFYIFNNFFPRRDFDSMSNRIRSSTRDMCAEMRWPV